MAFSSSDSPEEGLGAGDGVSGRLATAGSTGEVLRAAEGEEGDGKGVLTGGKREHSVSTELRTGVGGRFGVRGESLELGPDSSVNSRMFLITKLFTEIAVQTC